MKTKAYFDNKERLDTSNPAFINVWLYPEEKKPVIRSYKKTAANGESFEIDWTTQQCKDILNRYSTNEEDVKFMWGSINCKRIAKFSTYLCYETTKSLSRYGPSEDKDKCMNPSDLTNAEKCVLLLRYNTVIEEPKIVQPELF